MVEPFGARVRRALHRHGPLCVGIDPHASLLQAWGLPDSPLGLERLAMTTIEAVAGEVGVVKAQSAFFERHGAAGIAVLERTINAARDSGLLVILDVKRGDIGSTATAYAAAYLDPSSPMCADAITVSPYLGFGALGPFFDAADTHGGGVFVLALTSNPEGVEVQQAMSGPETVAGAILRRIGEYNAGIDPLGSIGAVVGVTIGTVSEDLDVNGPLLAPGLGAQGGSAADVERLFGAVQDNVIASSSRGVLAAGPDARAIRAAAAAQGDLLRSALA